jgi:DNA polymerase-3 subunit beta
VARAGQALVPARQFLDIVRRAAGDELAIVAESGRVWVRADGAGFELRGDDPARFPSFPPCPAGVPLELSAEPLRRAIRRTVFAAGTGDSRHSRPGVLWEVEAGRVRLVATDNRRLAVAEVASPVRGGFERALVPVRAAELLGRLAGVSPGAVRVLFGARHAFVRAPGAALCARLMEGRFPEWRRALPSEGGVRCRLLLPVGEFLACVKRAAVLRDRPEARVLLRLERGRVTLRSRQAGTGRAWVRQALARPCPRGPVEVAFNPNYLADLLRALDDAEPVQLELRGPEAPALFRAGDDYRHVLMPLRADACVSS